MRQAEQTYFTMRQVRERYNCSKSTIERWQRHEQLPRGIKLSDKRNAKLRIPASRLYAWERQKGMEPVTGEEEDWLKDREWLAEHKPRPQTKHSSARRPTSPKPRR